VEGQCQALLKHLLTVVLGLCYKGLATTCDCCAPLENVAAFAFVKLKKKGGEKKHFYSCWLHSEVSF